MSEYCRYYSERGIPLLYTGKPLEVPVVTLENYTKWYRIYMVMPDGAVQDITNFVHEIEDSKVGSLQVDHLFHPRLIYRLAERLNATIDERAVEVAAGRWMIEYVDRDEYQFHDPSLDE